MMCLKHRSIFQIFFSGLLLALKPSSVFISCNRRSSHSEFNQHDENEFVFWVRLVPDGQRAKEKLSQRPLIGAEMINKSNLKRFSLSLSAARIDRFALNKLSRWIFMNSEWFLPTINRQWWSAKSIKELQMDFNYWRDKFLVSFKLKAFQIISCNPIRLQCNYLMKTTLLST